MKTKLLIFTIFAFGFITLNAQNHKQRKPEIITEIENLSNVEHPVVNNLPASSNNKDVYDKQAYGLFKTQAEGDNFVSVNLENGNTEIILEDVSTIRKFGSEFIDGVLYETKCASLPNELYLINPDGERVFVGDITGTNSKIRGLAYDYDNNIVYAAAKIANASADSYLYTLDMQTLELTLIGTIFTGSLTIKDIEYADGTMYGVEWENSSLWEINMQTGVGSYIGVLTGYYFNYNQSISYDKNSGIMYGMFFDNHAKFCTVNLTTGAATVIQQYGTNDRFYNFSVQPSAIVNITSFIIPNQIGETEIDNQLHTVTIYMPASTNITNLIPEIEVSDDVIEIDPASGIAQDFTNPVEYTLTGKYGNSHTWTASVVILSDENDITSFQIPEQIGETIIDAQLHTILVEVPEGTNVAALTPDIIISENATINPESGTTQDFTQPFVYTVTAESGDEQEWTVTVDILSLSNDITSFQIPEQTGETIIDAQLHTILVEVPEETTVAALTPDIIISENATINPESGTTQDFTQPFVYTVTAENGDEQEWTVTVDILSGIFSKNSNGFNIYPNPTNGIFTISGYRNILGLEITDITAKTIYTSDISNSQDEIKIDLSNQPKGIYFIKIKTETLIYTEKVIIK